MSENGQTPQPSPYPPLVKVDNSEPRQVVVVESPTPTIWDRTWKAVDESGSAISILIIIGIILSRKKLAAFIDAAIELLRLMRVTQSELVATGKKNSETLEQVAQNNVRVADTLAAQQKTLEQMTVDSPKIKDKQDDQIGRLKHVIVLLKFNQTLLIELAKAKQISVEGQPAELEDEED